jgi:hypothetical protein
MSSRNTNITHTHCKSKYQRIQKPPTKIYCNYLREKANNPVSVIHTWKEELKSLKAPFLQVLGTGCALLLLACSMGVRYYIIQCLNTAPLPRKHQGMWDTAPRYSFLPPSLTHSPCMLLAAGSCSLAAPQRHLPCACCNAISIYFWCSPLDPEWLFHSSDNYSKRIHIPPPPNLGGHPALLFPIH